jgi:hypothetical protein
MRRIRRPRASRTGDTWVAGVDDASGDTRYGMSDVVTAEVNERGTPPLPSDDR